LSINSSYSQTITSLLSVQYSRIREAIGKGLTHGMYSSMKSGSAVRLSEKRTSRDGRIAQTTWRTYPSCPPQRASNLSRRVAQRKGHPNASLDPLDTSSDARVRASPPRRRALQIISDPARPEWSTTRAIPMRINGYVHMPTSTCEGDGRHDAASQRLPGQRHGDPRVPHMGNAL